MGPGVTARHSQHPNIKIASVRVASNSTDQRHRVDSIGRNWRSNLHRCELLVGQAAGAGADRVLPAEDHRAWSADGAVRLRLTETGPQAVPPVSVPTLFRGVVERLPGGLALRTRGPAGEYRDWTFHQYHQDVRSVGSVLRLLRV